MIDNKIDNFIEKALVKMFTYVDEEFSVEYCKQPDWYLNHSWTKEQQNEFKEWFISEFKKEFKGFRTKKIAERDYEYFNLNFGWKLKDEK